MLLEVMDAFGTKVRHTAARYSARRARRAPSGSRARGDAGNPQCVAARARLCCQHPGER